jgi:thiol-disulfide isomerase/thioredoxin
MSTRFAIIVIGLVICVGSGGAAWAQASSAETGDKLLTSFRLSGGAIEPIRSDVACFGLCLPAIVECLDKRKRDFLSLKSSRYDGFWSRLSLPFPNSSPASDDIKQIDLEGLKKLIQRDPKDARPLLVNFWATWCDPCREEFPDLVKIDADYRAKNLNFVTVSLDDVSEIATEVPKFLKEMKATMPTVLLNVNDPEPAIKSVDAAWDGQLPATFLYDKDGKVVFRHFGKIKADELRAAIDKVVSRTQ